MSRARTLMAIALLSTLGVELAPPRPRLPDPVPPPPEPVPLPPALARDRLDVERRETDRLTRAEKRARRRRNRRRRIR